MRERARADDGQAAVMLVALLVVAGIVALALGLAAGALGARGDAQRAADLAALAGARVLRDEQHRLFEAAAVDGVPNAGHLERAELVALARKAAERTVRGNGARPVAVRFPGGARDLVPLRVVVEAAARAPERSGVGELTAEAEAEVVPSALPGAAGAGAGEFRGPFAVRQGQRMRPDVALAFDRMAAAARADGVALVIVSAFRSDAEQAVLFARNPDPKWVARPGESLHRLGTELDLGPESAYGWLARNAPRFHFVQRYSWEAWHFGFSLGAGSASLGYGSRSPRGRAAGSSSHSHAGAADGAGHAGSLPGFVPARFAPAISRAAQRWNVGAAVLAAQLWQESRFNPFARSGAGAQGIAQFMPGTARAYGLANPYDADAAIDAQAHLMRDLLRQFGSVPLALAAYNAGPGRVAACGCIPPIPETRAYVAAILGLLGGAGVAAGGAGEVRLVR